MHRSNIDGALELQRAAKERRGQVSVFPIYKLEGNKYLQVIYRFMNLKNFVQQSYDNKENSKHKGTRDDSKIYY